MALAQPQAPYDAEGERLDPRSVGGQFGDTESLEARAYREESAANDSMYEAATNDTYYEERERVTIEQENHRRVALQEELIHHARRAALQKRTAAHKAKFAAKRGIATIAKWFSVSIAPTAYFFQLLFAVVSLVGYGFQAALGTTTVGGVVKFLFDIANSIISFFGGAENLISFQSLGLLGWAISTIVALFVFIAFLLWYYLTGVRVLGTTLSTLVTAVCLALSILPISNLFPWLVLWILYMNTTSLFSDIKYLASKS